MTDADREIAQLAVLIMKAGRAAAVLSLALTCLATLFLIYVAKAASVLSVALIILPNAFLLALSAMLIETGRFVRRSAGEATPQS